MTDIKRRPVPQATMQFATKVANAAKEGTTTYRYVETINGKEVIIIGRGYHMEVFTIDGANCTPKVELTTRNPFKQHIINSLMES